MDKLFVISLGGSRINPGQVDTDFLKKFRDVILSEIKKKRRFIIITGGGSISRQYQTALSEIIKPNPAAMDWMGICATKFNAGLIQLMFGDRANPNIIADPNKKISFKEKVLVAGGWTPGRSTDDVSVRLAKTYGAKHVINLFDQNYVYDSDPRSNPKAKKIERISWKDFRKITGTKWNPGAHVPFDPTAATFAMEHKLKVIIANGKNLPNLKNILDGKPFTGTLVE